MRVWKVVEEGSQGMGYWDQSQWLGPGSLPAGGTASQVLGKIALLDPCEHEDTEPPKGVEGPRI